MGTTGAKCKEVKFQGFKISLQGLHTDLAMQVKNKVIFFTEESTASSLAAQPAAVCKRLLRYVISTIFYTNCSGNLN